MTNKLGGVHYDDVRRPEEHSTEIVLDGLGHRPRSDTGLVLSFGGTVDHPGLHLVYLELLSIGQAVVNSPGVRALAEQD